MPTFPPTAPWSRSARAAPEPQSLPAFYAPVAFRIQTYEPPINVTAQRYAAQLRVLPSMQEWYRAALAETTRDEPHEAELKGIGEITSDLRATNLPGLPARARRGGPGRARPIHTCFVIVAFHLHVCSARAAAAIQIR